MFTLERVAWSRPCLSLIKQIQNLDSEKPAIAHIRHTERAALTPEAVNNPAGWDHRTFASTDLGKQAAFDFGASLPHCRDYRIFHTNVDRARETAEGIARGIEDVGGKAELRGDIHYWPVLDEKARSELSKRRLLRYGFDAFPDGGAVNWICGFNPTGIIKPSLEFAQDIAKKCMDDLRSATSKDLLLYVSHDMWVLTLMFHWFALLPYTEGLPFLDGFVMQLCDDGFNISYRNNTRRYEYPYWWPAPQ